MPRRAPSSQPGSYAMHPCMTHPPAPLRSSHPCILIRGDAEPGVLFLFFITLAIDSSFSSLLCGDYGFCPRFWGQALADGGPAVGSNDHAAEMKRLKVNKTLAVPQQRPVL